MIITCTIKQGGQNLDKNSLSHTKRRCKYHIVFAPKYRRKVIYRQLRKDIGSILRELCSRKGIKIIEAELCPDHVHMLVEIPPKYSIPQIMGYIRKKFVNYIRQTCKFEI